MNATAVLYEGDPAGLAQAVAQRLSAIDDALLPTMPVDAARALAHGLALAAAGAVPVLGAGQVVAERGDGRAVLRPAVHLVTRPDAGTLNVELPFACVWIAPWSRADGLDPLRNSLVLNAITDDHRPDRRTARRADRDQGVPRAGANPPVGTAHPARRVPRRLPDAQQGIPAPLNPRAAVRPSSTHDHLARHRATVDRQHGARDVAATDHRRSTARPRRHLRRCPPA